MALLAVLLMVGADEPDRTVPDCSNQRWARRTGRRPWFWLLGANVAANILWAALRPFLTQR